MTYGLHKILTKIIELNPIDKAYITQSKYVSQKHILNPLLPHLEYIFNLAINFFSQFNLLSSHLQFRLPLTPLLHTLFHPIPFAVLTHFIQTCYTLTLVLWQ